MFGNIIPKGISNLHCAFTTAMHFTHYSCIHVHTRAVQMLVVVSQSVSPPDRNIWTAVGYGFMNFGGDFKSLNKMISIDPLILFSSASMNLTF